MKYSKLLTLIALASLGFTSCKKDETVKPASSGPVTLISQDNRTATFLVQVPAGTDSVQLIGSDNSVPVTFKVMRTYTDTANGFTVTIQKTENCYLSVYKSNSVSYLQFISAF